MSRRLAFIVPSLVMFVLPLLAGCSAETSDDSSGNGNEGAAVDDVTQFIADSTYTDVWTEGPCRITQTSDESEVSEAKCTSPKPGVSLFLWSGDLRERASIGRDGTTPFEIDLMSRVPEGAAWNTLGPKAEWRTPRGKSNAPYALILRHAYELEGRTQHYLAVVKIADSGFCLAGIVEASKNAANANALSRKIADDFRTQSVCPKSVTITSR